MRLSEPSGGWCPRILCPSVRVVPAKPCAHGWAGRHGSLPLHRTVCPPARGPAPFLPLRSFQPSHSRSGGRDISRPYAGPPTPPGSVWQPIPTWHPRHTAPAGGIYPAPTSGPIGHSTSGRTRRAAPTFDRVSGASCHAPSPGPYRPCPQPGIPPSTEHGARARGCPSDTRVALLRPPAPPALRA